MLRIPSHGPNPLGTVYVQNQRGLVEAAVFAYLDDVDVAWAIRKSQENDWAFI